MASKTTKTVSVRLPMDYYFKILEETSKNNITISDYILMRIHSNISNEDVFNSKTNNEELIHLRNELSNKEEEVKRTNEILETYHNALNDFKEYYNESKNRDVYSDHLIRTLNSFLLEPKNFDDEKEYNTAKTFVERFFSINDKLSSQIKKIDTYLSKN